nr:uncharacterized protein LOC110086609 isoform X3 [Pogona vitticeps]
MAAEDAKQKPDDAKPADDKEEKKPLKEKLKDFFQSTMGIYIAIVMTVIFIASAIICIYICVLQWNKTADLRNAMYLVRKFMISKDTSYEQKGDIETIFDADQIAGDLAALALLLNELEAEIVDIRYRLSHDWMAEKNILYRFAKQGSTFWEAKQFCENDKAKIAKIENAEEEILDGW